MKTVVIISLHRKSRKACHNAEEGTLVSETPSYACRRFAAD